MGMATPIVWTHVLWCAMAEAEIGVFDDERSKPPKVDVISSLLLLRGINSYPNHRSCFLFPSDHVHLGLTAYVRFSPKSPRITHIIYPN